MSAIFPKLNYFVKERLLKLLRQCRSRIVHEHILIALNLSAGRRAVTVAGWVALEKQDFRTRCSTSGCQERGWIGADRTELLNQV